MPQEPKSVKESFIQFNIRLPEFVKKQMERAGKKNVRSQNEEAIYRLHNFTEHEVMIADHTFQKQLLMAAFFMSFNEQLFCSRPALALNTACLRSPCESLQRRHVRKI